MEKKIEELKQLQAKAKVGGGLAAIERQHSKGKLSARERLDLLLDKDTFVELNMLAKHRCTYFNMSEKTFLGDGVITGYGEIGGRLVFVYSQDAAVLGGSVGETNGQKIIHVMRQARKLGAPIIGLIDSSGARIQEGSLAARGYAEMFFENSITSGVVPQISAIMGTCAGGAVYSPALTDFIFMVEETSQMFLTGPGVIKLTTGEDVTMQTLGGTRIHSELSGVAQFTAKSDEECLRLVRKLLSFFPSNNKERPPIVPCKDDLAPLCPKLAEIVPAIPSKVYDMHHAIYEIIDGRDFMEVSPRFAKNMIVGFARFGGMPAGIVANQPFFKAGCIDIDAADKAARFVRFCNAFNIPLVTVVDVPGYLPGVDQEYGGVIRHGAKLLYAYSEATVPKITFILRKDYGGAISAMCPKQMGADFVYAWPTAEIAILGARQAVDIIFRKDIEASENPEELRQLKIDEYQKKFCTPYEAASNMIIDDVIDPGETRGVIISGLQILQNKKEERPWKRNGNIPL